MILPSQVFTEINSVGNRARCPKCDDGNKNYNVQIEPDHAFCHKCTKTWWFEDNKKPAIGDIEPPKVKERLYVKSSGAVKKSGYVKDRANFLAHWKKVKKQ